MAILLEKILKAAQTEADWLRYYGHSETRLVEKFEDCKFYDRITSIGYAKRNIPLPNRCSMLNITSDKPVLESDVEDLREEYSLRDHNNNVYTALEYLIDKGIEVDNLIKIVRGEK
jgi:hypothetical protein